MGPNGGTAHPKGTPFVAPGKLFQAVTCNCTKVLNLGGFMMVWKQVPCAWWPYLLFVIE